MTVLVRDFLRGGGSYGALLEKHGVHAKPHNGKVSFVYDMLQARRDDLLANQCRGLILREGSWDLVAHPFDRFFNHNETPYAAELDWASAAFEEKLDGTLIIAYWDDQAKKWASATRSMCEAHGNINGEGTFADLADRAAEQMGGYASFSEFMLRMYADIGYTYMFELTSPLNRLVVDYRDFRLTLLGARNLETGKECMPVWPHPVPQRWEFSSIEALLDVAKTWGAFEYEGAVVKDAAFRRVKVKSPAYLAAAHLHDSLASSYRGVLELVRSGKDDDALSIAPPAVAERILALREALRAVVTRAESDLESLSGIDEMKVFALWANKTPWSAPLFAVKRGKAASVSAFAASCHIDGLLDLCMKELRQ